MDQQVPITRDGQVSSTQSNRHSSLTTLNATQQYYGTNGYMEQNSQYSEQVGHSFNEDVTEMNLVSYQYGYTEPSDLGQYQHGQQSFSNGPLAGQTQPVSAVNAPSNYYVSTPGNESTQSLTHAHNANISQPPFVGFSQADSPMFSGQTSHPNGIQNQLPEVQDEEDVGQEKRKIKSAKISRKCRDRKKAKYEKSRETSSEVLKLAEHFIELTSYFHYLDPNYLHEFGSILKENAELLISCHECENNAPAKEVDVKAEQCFADNNNFIARWSYPQDKHQQVPQHQQIQIDNFKYF